MPFYHFPSSELDIQYDVRFFIMINLPYLELPNEKFKCKLRVAFFLLVLRLVKKEQLMPGVCMLLIQIRSVVCGYLQSTMLYLR